MRTQTRRGNRFVCCRPGAQAPRLQVSAHAMPMSMNQKASRVRPSSLQARPRGCVLVNLSMKTDTRLDENRFVRCSSGSSPPCSRWPLIDSSPSLSSPPALPPASRHPAGLPRLVSFSRSGCLPAPGSRLPCFDPPLHLAWFRAKLLLGRFRERLSAASSACHARPLEACGACFRLDSFAMESIESGEWTWHDAGVCA